MKNHVLFVLAALASGACLAPASPPLPGARQVDLLIEPGEPHFTHLWQLTAGGENAEGYWSFDGRAIVFQHRNQETGIACDRIFMTDRDGAPPSQVSNGSGVTTCAYFLPGDERVLFASTHGRTSDCPPPPDHSRGYVWNVHPEYDIWLCDLETHALTPLIDGWGYDAEATVSPRGDRLVFTSTRSGDLEIWTAALDGSDLVQVTDAPGYDGGAFFSHDGRRLVFRSTAFDPDAREEELADYRALLAEWKVRPTSMELMLIDPDGSNRTQLTRLGGANFAPFFFPDDQSVIFSSNHHERVEGGNQRNFDLFAIGTDGRGLERVTTYSGFDSFPMFSPDGRYLAFASNRGGTQAGETNLFIAEWR